MKFMDLPDGILNRIISYLPQQDIINLSQTNYKYYQPCTNKLYSKLLISTNPIIDDGDWKVGNFTAISGFSYHKYGKLYTESSQLKLVNARLSILTQSIDVNEELATKVEEIHVIVDNFDEELIDNLQSLFINIFTSKELPLNKLYISNQKLRLKLDVKNLKVRSQIIDKATVVNHDLRELIISRDFDFTSLSKATMNNITSLILPSEEQTYWKFIHTVIVQRNQKLNLKTFKLVFNIHNYQENVYLFHQINWELIENLEVHLGLPKKPDLLTDLLHLIPTKLLTKLKKISIVQSKLYDLHTINEQFDYIIFDFINSLIGTSPKLAYISIYHNLPNFGNFTDGFEGNYLRRKQLYSALLPKILSKSNNYLELYLPNLFQTLTCYEQPMNTLMWNGCKCSHCETYLQYLDEFMMHHRYYNEKQLGYKDLNCSGMLFTVGFAIKQRYITDSLMTNLHFAEYPKQDRLYDFHSTASGVPFKCYEDEIVEHGLLDESEPVQSDELHNKAKNSCKFNEKLFYRNYEKVVSHYLDTVLTRIVHLDRGNAEEEVIGVEMNDGGETDYNITIKKIAINSVEYYIKQEKNGTFYFTSTDN